MIKIKRISNRLDKDKIIIFIDGWLSNELIYLLDRESIPENFGYIQYDYSDDLLCSNPIKTKKNFLALINKIENDLAKLQDKKPRNFYMYGQSLGTLFCMIVADKVYIKEIKLLVPGYNLAEAFWFGKSTQKLKNEMVIKHNMNLVKLKNYWKEISPDNYFKKKSIKTKFNVTISTNDSVIPTENGKKLIKLIKSKNIPIRISKTILPHTIEIIKEGLFVSNFNEWVNGLK